MPNGKGRRPRRPPWERPSRPLDQGQAYEGAYEEYLEGVRKGIYDFPEPWQGRRPERSPWEGPIWEERFPIERREETLLQSSPIQPFMQRTPSFLYNYPGSGMGPSREKAWEWRRMADAWEKARAWEARLTPRGTERWERGPIGVREEASPIPRSLAEGARERWFGAWPGQEMTAPFREFVGREAGWTQQAEKEFSPIPLTVNWQRTGGGGWLPWNPSIELGGPSVEGATHEYAHVWYQPRMEDKAYRDRLVAAVMRLAEETDPQYQPMAELARDYVYGDPWTGYGGMNIEKPGVGAGPGGTWCDWEMFAGLASGTKGNLALLPPYLRPYFTGMFSGRSEYEPFGRPYPGHRGGPEPQFPPWAAHERVGKRVTGMVEQMFGGGR